MADNRIAYGMLKQAGVDTEGMSPKEAWERVEDLQLGNIVEGNLHKKIKLSSNEQSKRAKQANDPQHSPNLSYVPKTEYEIAGVNKGPEMSFNQANSKHVNPFYDSPDLYGYDNNCQVCVAVFEARLRGYDVRALPNNLNDAIRTIEKNHAYLFVDRYGKTPEPFERLPKQNDWDYIKQWVKEGNRYTLKWDNKFMYNSHVISVTKEKGKLLFYDPQKSIKYNEYQFTKAMKRIVPNTIQIMRIDNLSFNRKYVHKVMKGNNYNDKR